MAHGDLWTGNGLDVGQWPAWRGVVRQRIPDGEVGCSANRSRIGAVDLNDSDHFLASGNIFSLAQALGFWQPGTRFLWREVYGGPGDRSNSLREWRALSLMAPSLGLKVTGDPQLDRYPFSVKPDQPLTVPQLRDLMRDNYQGTEFDVTAQAALKIKEVREPVGLSLGTSGTVRLAGVDARTSHLHAHERIRLCGPAAG